MEQGAEENKVIFDISKNGSNNDQGISSIDSKAQEGLVNIDDIMILQTSNNLGNSNDDIYIPNDEPTNNLNKFKILGIGAAVIVLIFVTGILVYMMYPVEFENLGNSIKGDVTNTNTQSGVNNSGNNIDNGNNLTLTQVDTSGKQAIDDLFMGNNTNTTQSDNNTNIDNNENTNIDDPNNLIQNPDGSNGLNDNSNILEGLNTGANYGNGDEQGKIEILSQIRAKIEIAKINYNQAKETGNTKAMKLIASANIQYKDLLEKVENNEIVVKSEAQDKLVEIQAIVDEAKILIE